MTIRRWVATLFLVLVAFYLSAGRLDRCDETPMERGQVCQLLCSDGCATAPIPVAPVAPPPDPMPKRIYTETLVCSVLELDREPETAPPRA